MKYLTIKQYAEVSPYSLGAIERFVKSGKIETTTYLSQKVIDVEKYPIPEKKESGGRKIGSKNKKEALTDEQRKEKNRLAVQKFREKNKKE